MLGDEKVGVYHPRLWYPVAVLIGGAVVAVLIRLLIDLPLSVAVTGPVAGAWAAARALRLTLSSSGVALANRSSSWESLELVSTRWGESLRTRPRSRKDTARLSVMLPLYERDWRNGAVGRDIERWAPSLLRPGAPGRA